MHSQPPQPPVIIEGEVILGQVVNMPDEQDLGPLPKLAPANGICNARRTKVRAYCKAPSMANGRCDKHGGKSPKGAAAGRFKDGKTSKYAYMPPNLTLRMERLNGDVLDNLEDSIGIQKTLETQIHEQLKSGESGVVWQELKDLVVQVSFNLDNPPEVPEDCPPDEAGEFYEEWTSRIKAAAYDRAAELIRDGKKKYNALQEMRRDIQSIHDSQRKLTETLTKCRKEVQETYTQEQWNGLLQMNLAILREILTRDQLVQYSERVTSLQQRPERQLNP